MQNQGLRRFPSRIKSSDVPFVNNRHWFHLELSHRDTGGDERIAEVAGDVFVM